MEPGTHCFTYNTHTYTHTHTHTHTHTKYLHFPGSKMTRQLKEGTTST